MKNNHPAGRTKAPYELRYPPYCRAFVGHAGCAKAVTAARIYSPVDRLRLHR